MVEPTAISGSQAWLVQCQCLGFLIFFFLFSFLLSATLPGNTGSHFTHDLTLWLRIAVAVQLGFSLTGGMLQLGSREVRLARAHKAKHVIGVWRILYVCLLLGLQHKGKRLAQVFSEPR